MAGLGGFSMVITMTLFCCFILLHGGVALRFGDYGGSFGGYCDNKEQKERWEKKIETGSGIPSGSGSNSKHEDGRTCTGGYKLSRTKDDPGKLKELKDAKEAYKLYCRESKYEPPYKAYNKLVNKKLGHLCQSGTCHYHYEIDEFVCRSSSVQATFGLIVVLLVGLCLRQVIS